MDISSALETLRNASPQVLQSYRHEAIKALQEIEARLRESDSREQASEAISARLPSSAEQPLLISQANSKPSRSTTLLAAMTKISPWVWQSTNFPPSKVLRIKRPHVCDRRLEDIRRIEGEPKAEPKYKIMRVLAQRSLVLQGEKSGYLNVGMYCEIASSRKPGEANKGRQGKIASYVREELNIEEEDKAFAIRAISAGIKQLVVERLLKNRLDETSQCGSSSGISAFTALVIRPFRYLKYEEIPKFLDELLEKGTLNMPASEKGNLERGNSGTEVSETENIQSFSTKEVIQVTSAWFDNLQAYYDKYLGVREDVDQRQSNKRKQTRPNFFFSNTNSSNRSLPHSAFSGARDSFSVSTSGNGSIHYRRTGRQENQVPIAEVLEDPPSINSGSPRDTGLETPLFVGSGSDDQGHTQQFDPPSQNRCHPVSQIESSHDGAHNNALSQQIFDPACTTNLFQPRRGSGNTLYGREVVESGSNLENATLDIVSSQCDTCQRPSTQSYVNTNSTQVPFDPWQNVHATAQLSESLLEPQPSTNSTQVPFDPWQNVHATAQLNDPAPSPYADTDGTRISLHSSQQVPYQVRQHPVCVTQPLYRGLAARSDHTANQFSTPVGKTLQAAQ